MFRTQFKIICLFVLGALVSACTASLPVKPPKSKSSGTAPATETLPVDTTKSVAEKKAKIHLAQMPTPKTLNWWDVDYQFKKVGKMVGM